MNSTIIKAVSAGVVALIALIITQPSNAQTVTWGTEFGAKLFDSTGAPLGAEFEFELGSFHQGFDPAESDPTLWESDWEGFDRATTENLGFSAAFGFVSREVAINEDGMTTSTAFLPIEQNFDFRDSDIYLWVYRENKDIDGGNEFALITDSSWKFPATVSPTGNPLEYRIALTNSAVIGNSANASFALQTAAVGSAVPEPSTGLLIFLGSAGLLLRRQRRG